MRKYNLLLCLALVTSSSFSQFSVSANHRYLLKNGEPFFWMGDTAWELFHRLDSSEADLYFKKRAAQGFNVVQAVVLAELDGLHTPNANGDTPFINDDPAKPNEKYFKYVDWVVDKAATYHINIAMLPTWGDKVFKDKWGMGPEIFNASNGAAYAGWLAERYKNKQNIIWVLGGDRVPRNDADLGVWRAMGTAIMKATGNKAVISFHTQPNQLGSAQWFINDEWLAFTMFQTGHCRDAAVYDNIQRVYNLPTVKPVMDAEPIYEDHPVCFNAKELGVTNAFDVRRSAYLDLLAGAFGHTYGCHDVWQMNSSKHEPVNNPHYTWKDALDLPAANQMQYVKNLVESFPLADRVPDQSIIVESNNTPAERIQAARGKDYLFVYSCAGKPFTVLPGKIQGKQLEGFWYNPRNGKTTAVTGLSNTVQNKYTPPTTNYGQDWILVLYDAQKHYTLKS